jgi:hypothetical protein
LTETTNQDPLYALPGYALRRASNAMMAELATRLGGLDLRISDASVLMLIDGRDDMTSSEIGKMLDIARANMVPLLNRLEGRPDPARAHRPQITGHRVDRKGQGRAGPGARHHPPL